MSRRDDYRGNAANCMKLAAVVNDPPTRLVFLNMAAAWLRLADYVALGKSANHTRSTKMPMMEAACRNRARAASTIRIMTNRNHDP